VTDLAPLVIRCPEPGCTHTCPSPARLAGHLINQHRVRHDIAIERSKRSGLPVREQAVPVTVAVMAAPIPPPAPKEIDLANVCSYCKRVDGTHSASCPRAAGCKLCKKRAPEKCPHHGGTQAQPRRRKIAATTNGHGKAKKAVAVDNEISSRIKSLRATVDEGHRAQAQLDAIREALV
jgi:hypothetical protein